MQRLGLLCFFIFFIPALGCVGSENIEHLLLENLSAITSETDEEVLGAIVLSLLEAATGAEVNTVIDENGAGVLRYGFGYEPSALVRVADNLPADFLGSMDCARATRLLMAAAPVGATSLQEARGSAIWCIISVPFADTEQLASHYQSIFHTPAVQSQDLSTEKKNVADVRQPLINVACLALVDDVFYQELWFNQAALRAADVELLKLFGIELNWTLTLPGRIRHHNASTGLAIPLSWQLLEAPQWITVNMESGAPCPSSPTPLQIRPNLEIILPPKSTVKSQTVNDLLKYVTKKSAPNSPPVKRLSDFIDELDDGPSSGVARSEMASNEVISSEAISSEVISSEAIDGTIDLIGSGTLTAYSASGEEDGKINENVSNQTAIYPECMVVIEWLNLRPGPGIEYGSPVDRLPAGTKLLITGRDQGGSWLQVMSSDRQQYGWVSLSSAFVLCDAGVAESPIIDPSADDIQSGNIGGKDNSTVDESTVERPEIKPLVVND